MTLWSRYQAGWRCKEPNRFRVLVLSNDRGIGRVDASVFIDVVNVSNTDGIRRYRLILALAAVVNSQRFVRGSLGDRLTL